MIDKIRRIKESRIKPWDKYFYDKIDSCKIKHIDDCIVFEKNKDIIIKYNKTNKKLFLLMDSYQDLIKYSSDIIIHDATTIFFTNYLKSETLNILYSFKI